MKDAEDEAWDELERRQAQGWRKRQIADRVEPDSKWTPVEIGVDVAPDGTHVSACYVLMPEAVRYIFYSQFHPMPAKHGNSYEAGWNSALEMAAFKLTNEFRSAFGADTLASIAVYIKGMKK